MTDQLVENILMDPESSVAERGVAEAHMLGETQRCARRG